MNHIRNAVTLAECQELRLINIQENMVDAHDSWLMRTGKTKIRLHCCSGWYYYSLAMFVIKKPLLISRIKLTPQTAHAIFIVASIEFKGTTIIVGMCSWQVYLFSSLKMAKKTWMCTHSHFSEKSFKRLYCNWLVTLRRKLNKWKKYGRNVYQEQHFM